MQQNSPRNTFSDYLHGLESLKKKDFDTALTSFRSAVKISPDLPLVHHYLGETYFAISEFDKAEISFLRAVELDPHSSTTYLYLGKIAEMRGNRDGKNELFERAFSQKTGSSYEPLQLVQTLIKIGESGHPALPDLYVEALRLKPDGISLHLEVTEIYPPNSTLFSKFGEQLIKFGKPELATVYLYLAAHLDPQKRENWLTLSRALEQLGDASSAEICRERAKVVD